MEQELSAYAPDPDIFAALEDKIPPLQTTVVTVMGTEKVTQFNQISDLDESQKMLITCELTGEIQKGVKGFNRL